MQSQKKRGRPSRASQQVARGMGLLRESVPELDSIIGEPALVAPALVSAQRNAKSIRVEHSLVQSCTGKSLPPVLSHPLASHVVDASSDPGSMDEGGVVNKISQ